MKTTKYTNKELVEIYKSLKTSAKILGFSSVSDSEMIAEIELEAVKRHLNLIDGTVEETAERQEVITMKTKMYWASVRNKETNQIEIIKRDDYSSKKDFAHDLRVNGYAVKFISIPEKFDEDCENYHWELERRKNIGAVAKQHKSQPTEQTVETTTEESSEVETVKKTERKINMKKSYNEMTIEELNKEHIRLINWADEAETDRQAKSRLKKVSEFETYYKSRVEELRATQATGETTVQETMEAATEADDSGFEYTRSQAQEVIMTGTSIAKAEEQKTQFDFYNVTIGFEVEKFIGTIPADYESLGIYSDYEKAVQAAQAAADEYGAKNIYFHTVEIATLNDREVYDRDDYEDFIEERETIRHNWYTLTIVDTGKREHVNLDKPVRLDFEE